MTLLPRRRGTTRRMIGVVTVILLFAGIHSGVAASAPATAATLDAWHATMAKVAAPATPGCFTADYPGLAWRETACVAPPSAPMVPKRPAPPNARVGSGYDIVAQAPTASGVITQATGSFDSVTGVSNVRSPLKEGGAPVPNAYSLQLNTNFFAAAECAGAAEPTQCTGWKQFVFANSGTTGRIFVEYWLLVYNNPCPAGWVEYPPYLPEIYCYQKSAATETANVPITDIANPNLALTGVVNAGTDTDTAIFHNGTSMMASVAPTRTHVLAPDPGWVKAEFNVFGFGNASTAEFNTNPGDPTANLTVRTKINHGGVEAPLCKVDGFTGESNNLNFGTAPDSVTPGGPAVIFNEKTGDALADGCNAAVTIGDTHQRTFAGLLYDFQATGDFVEAQVGSAFEVQTRKVSGAPSWPNASVNRSVATRMGATRVALCDGTRLVVDGRTTELASGAAVLLPGGVGIRRDGNRYLVRDQAGNSVRVTANTGANPVYSDLQIGLGTWPVTVRGLLGNPDHNPRLLEAKDGARFSIPISFSDLYTRFGASWRANPVTSLLQTCDAVSVGNPSGPFFTGHLDPTVRQRAEAVCRQAQVPAAWLDTCTLDAAVLGPGAPAVYVGRPAPVVNANPAPATHAGMTWTVLEQRSDGIVRVGSDARTNPYQGDTAATTALPVLCLRVDGRAAPAGIPTTGFHSWAFGEVKVTSPVPGSALTSRAAADQVCASAFGTGWRTAEFHDGVGWSLWASGTLPGGRFWTAINDQPANPWS